MTSAHVKGVLRCRKDLLPDASFPFHVRCVSSMANFQQFEPTIFLATAYPRVALFAIHSGRSTVEQATEQMRWLGLPTHSEQSRHALSCVAKQSSANHAQLSEVEQEVLWEYAKLADKMKRVSDRTRA